LSFEFLGIIGLLHGNPQDWQRRDLKYPINVAVWCSPIGSSMGGIIEFNCDDWRKCGVADHEIDVFGAHTSEVGQPQTMTLIGFDQISQPDFREDSVWTDDASKNPVKVFFRPR